MNSAARRDEHEEVNDTGQYRNAAGEVCVDFAEPVGLDVSFAARPGTMTDWVMSSGLGDAFVVEFGYEKISQRTIDVHVDAIFSLGF